MSEIVKYPKRLIEVDLPIKEISAHARREKSIRHGHISTLHIWWARRPLAACRAVTCAALWPDPADELCPQEFRDRATKILLDFAETARTDKTVAELTAKHRQRWSRLSAGSWKPKNPASWADMRYALLDFIADFANWDASSVPTFLETSRALTLIAHETMGGDPGTRPTILDPFAGGGAIPLEVLRVGADAFASDINPVPVLLNKVVLEFIPQYGKWLADEVRKWGEWIKKEAEREIGELYPTDIDGAQPIAYLWARTIHCEGPGCGAEIPLIRSYILAKKKKQSIFLEPKIDSALKKIEFSITQGTFSGKDGTVRGGSAVCPICDYTTPNSRVRFHLSKNSGGASTARLLAVVVTRTGEKGRFYRVPEVSDFASVETAKEAALRLINDGRVPQDSIPTERPSPNSRGMSAVTRMGVRTFSDLYAPRQLTSISTFCSLVGAAIERIQKTYDSERAVAIGTCLALAVDRIADACSSLATWSNSGEFIRFTFARQALAIVWDFAECNPLADASGNWTGAIEWIAKAIDAMSIGINHPGTVMRSSATNHPLPDDCADTVITDPPYYDAVPYADLSEFFFVWLRISLRGQYPDLLSQSLPKDDEAIWNPSRIYTLTGKPKDEAFYENQMKLAFKEARRITKPDGIGVIVFAHKSTEGWEAVLAALLDAGWVATASWPIDTERSVRTNALGTASLASSVHIVCRPRENPDGTVRTDDIGDWRDVLSELPKRIHDWMPRLASEGVVGADAIFACLGPALEIFSRYSRVEKTSGDSVTLKEYLEHVWAAVAREALSTVLGDSDSGSLEPDARLSVIWLWTIGAAATSRAAANDAGGSEDDESEDDDEAASSSKSKGSGFMLEFDAARKIAQGLGAKLEELTHTVEVKGDKARLLSVAERMPYLFGKKTEVPTAKSVKKKKQLGLFGDMEETAQEETWGEVGAPSIGQTTLDRIHQSMLLFGAGRSEALKRFLVEEGVGKQAPFWKLAQSLSALYPAGTDEKRWVDGVLARKKGLGF